MAEENLPNSAYQPITSDQAPSSTNDPLSLHSEVGDNSTIDSTIDQLGGCGEGTGPCSEGSPLRILIKTMTHPDMRVRCCSNCLVKKLKYHIAKGFPTHPKVEDQKLISSGMLLRDDMTIKSALRIHLTPNKPADEDYIIHLVCNVKSTSLFKRQQSTNISNSNSNNSNLTENEDMRSFEPGSRSSHGNVQGSSSDGTQLSRPLQQCLSELSSDQYARMLEDMHKQHQAYFESIKAEVRKSFDERKPEKDELVKQLFQTSQMGSLDEPESSGDGANQSSLGGSQDENNNSSTNTETQAANGAQEQEVVAGQQPQQPRRMPQQILNAMGFGGAMGAAAEEEGEENDWLSWLYTATRLYLFGMILYFYSSLPRFLAVALITLLVVFFQRRWLPVFGQELMRRNRVDAPRNEEAPANQVPDGDNQNNEANDDQGANGSTDDQPAVAEEVNDINQTTENAEANSIPETEDTRRVISWMETVFVAITTFFMSLFPFELLRQE